MLIRFIKLEDTESAVALLHEMSRHYNGIDASPIEKVRVNFLDSIRGPSSGVQLVVAESKDQIIGRGWTVDADNSSALEFYRELGASQVKNKLYFRFGGKDLEKFASDLGA